MSTLINYRLSSSQNCTARQCWPIGQSFQKKRRTEYRTLISDECSIFSPPFIGFEETTCYWSVQFFSAFHWWPSLGKPPMTPAPFVKTTELYNVPLVNINRQTSYDFDILRQDYRIIRGLPIGSPSW